MARDLPEAKTPISKPMAPMARYVAFSTQNCTHKIQKLKGLRYTHAGKESYGKYTDARLCINAQHIYIYTKAALI
jgi:hypothetical protein